MSGCVESQVDSPGRSWVCWVRTTVRGAWLKETEPGLGELLNGLGVARDCRRESMSQWEVGGVRPDPFYPFPDMPPGFEHRWDLCCGDSELPCWSAPSQDTAPILIPSSLQLPGPSWQVILMAQKCPRLLHGRSRDRTNPIIQQTPISPLPFMPVTLKTGEERRARGGERKGEEREVRKREGRRG